MEEVIISCMRKICQLPEHFEKADSHMRQSHSARATPTVYHVDHWSVAHVKPTQGRRVLPVCGHEVRGLAKVLAGWIG